MQRTDLNNPDPGFMAAASAGHYELLTALRDRVALAVADPTCPPRDLAALTRRLQEISTALDNLDKLREASIAASPWAADGRFDPSTV